MRPSALGVTVLSAVVLLTGCADDPSTIGACQVETVADNRLADCDLAAGAADLPDLTLPCLGGDGEVTLADIKGPAIVNFWASWCGPCRKEMPVLEDFHEAYGDQVELVGVAIDTYPAAAADFAADKGVTYPSLLDGCGEIEESELALGRGLPQTVFVAEDGSIERHSGEIVSVGELAGLVEANLGIELEKSPA